MVLAITQIAPVAPSSFLINAIKGHAAPFLFVRIFLRPHYPVLLGLVFLASRHAMKSRPHPSPPKHPVELTAAPPEEASHLSRNRGDSQITLHTGRCQRFIRPGKGGFLRAQNRGKRFRKSPPPFAFLAPLSVEAHQRRPNTREM